jgi:hypothetical protein
MVIWSVLQSTIEVTEPNVDETFSPLTLMTTSRGNPDDANCLLTASTASGGSNDQSLSAISYQLSAVLLTADS